MSSTEKASENSIVKKSGKKLQIGVMLGNSQTEHPREIVTGIYDVLQEQDIQEENVQVTFFLGAQGRALELWDESVSRSSLSYVYQYNTLYDYSLIGSMDALVIAYGTISIYLNELEQLSFLPRFRSIPIVVLERFEEDLQCTRIMSDNYTSMRRVVEHLVEFHGYKNVIHLAGPRGSHESGLRQKAYMDVMSENGLTVTDKMIAEGDYTVNVEHIVEKLLDENPNAEALCCANDEMASAAYKVCKRRGLVVGKDIAITGYDDIDSAQKLDPPLTTANQDGTVIGFKSIKTAIKLCRKKEGDYSELIDAPLVIRGSCGCNYLSKNADAKVSECYLQIHTQNDNELIARTVTLALEATRRRVNIPESIENNFSYVCERMIRLLLKIRTGAYTFDDMDYIIGAVLNDLRSFIGADYDAFTECINLTKTLNYIKMFISNEMTCSTSRESILLINNVSNIILNYIEVLIVQEGTNKTDSLIKNGWAISSGIQRLTEKSHKNATLFGSALGIVKELGIKNALLCLNRKPIIVKKDSPVSHSKSMLMVAQMIDGNIESYDFDDAPKIDKHHGFSSYYPENSGCKPYSVFLLYQEEMQFGLLICETEFKNIDTLFSVALQISTALAFLYLRIQEGRSQAKLYDAMKSLEEKNKVLSFISSNDALTNLYNRRGFMEKIFEMQRHHEGERGYLFFFDLDHLKEINDVFGHGEGDFAIISSADFLKQAFEDIGFCARLGGDEFVGVMTADPDNPDSADDLLTELKDIMENFNFSSQKPYYVEFSAGYTSFVFNDALDVGAVLKGADNVLYEAKKSRRKSIKKA